MTRTIEVTIDVPDGCEHCRLRQKAGHGYEGFCVLFERGNAAGNIPLPQCLEATIDFQQADVDSQG